MKASEFFWRRDARRNRVRVTPIGWMSLVLIVVLVLAAGWSVFRPKPVVVAEEEPTPTPAPPTPTPTPIVHEACPSDPAMWRTEPYTLPNGKVLYRLDPSCAMGLVEEAYGELMEYMEARSDRWTKADAKQVYWWDGYVSPLTGENYPATDLDMSWEVNPDIHCWETVYHDPAGLRYVYYTAAPDDPGRVVLYVISPPYETRRYNCDTGETGMERGVDEYQGFYATLIYDRESQEWKMGLAAEEFTTLPSDADVDGSIALIRQLQGR
jgi:hypothetical protein